MRPGAALFISVPLLTTTFLSKPSVEALGIESQRALEDGGPVTAGQDAITAQREVLAGDQECVAAPDSSVVNAAGRALLQKEVYAIPTLIDIDGSAIADPSAASVTNATRGSTLVLRQAPHASKDKVWAVKQVACGELLNAPKGNCPAACPFYREEEGEGIDNEAMVCHFRCVTLEDCGALNPEKHIGDVEGRYCRSCKAPGCIKCSSITPDTCIRCDSGYLLDAKTGNCYSRMWLLWDSLFILVGVIVVLLVAWYIDLRRRPIVNPEGLEDGLSYRSRLKLHMPRHFRPSGEAESGPKLWPLSTSLIDIDVAGPGLLLHFNFHVLLIVWACVCVAAWIVWAYSTEIELLVLGLYAATTPQEMCEITIQGREAQKKMMWAKVLFLIILYVGSFLGFLAYGIYSERRYQYIDATTTSMRDYAVLCTGLPKTPGTQKLEEQFAQALREITGQAVVGISVAWDFREQAEAVKEAVETEMEKLAQEQTSQVEDEDDSEQVGADARGGVFGIIDNIFGFGPASFDASSGGRFKPIHESRALGGDRSKRLERFPGWRSRETGRETEMGQTEELLRGISSTDSAFAVFESESARDAAIEAAQRIGGMSFQGSAVKLAPVANEPATVCWEIFAIEANNICVRVVIGVASILAAVIIWCATFYFPYAYYTASFSAAHNEEPGFLSGLTFTMLVVGGNQAMYFLCNQIAYRIGFRFSDDAEAFYIGLYTFSCFLNLMVDLMMEGWLGYHAMVSAGVHAADGRLIGSLEEYEEIFESYPMQRAMGRRLFAYCFPSTFFIPFIFEPIFAIYVPYHLMKLMLGRHRGVRGREAEKTLQFFAPMDLGRYGDLTLNVVLTSLVFFLPPGEMLKLLLALVISHTFIYSYDKYRVLRAVPGFCFAGSSAEKCAQGILALPCAVTLMAIVFKANCQTFSPWCTRGSRLATACGIAFVVHITIHLLCLKYLVPMFVKKENITKADAAEESILTAAAEGSMQLLGKMFDADAKKPGRPLVQEQPAAPSYAETARDTPCTWFSSNPVHCLRSKYIYGHDPACCYFDPGQEHLMRANEQAASYYEDRSKEGCTEDYNY